MDLPGNHIPLSPPASAASPAPTTTSFTNQNPDLPAPRSHRLRPGSPKEIALINYLDDKILRITRRYAKKFSDEMASKDDAKGYTAYEEFVADVDPLVDVAWISGTRKSSSLASDLLCCRFSPLTVESETIACHYDVLQFAFEATVP